MDFLSGLHYLCEQLAGALELCQSAREPTVERQRGRATWKQPILTPPLRSARLISAQLSSTRSSSVNEQLLDASERTQCLANGTRAHRTFEPKVEEAMKAFSRSALSVAHAARRSSSTAERKLNQAAS